MTDKWEHDDEDLFGYIEGMDVLHNDDSFLHGIISRLRKFGRTVWWWINVFLAWLAIFIVIVIFTVLITIDEFFGRYNNK
jgi:hypothetical protein